MPLAFWRDRRGNFSIIASIAAVPLILGAGMAIDASTINEKKTQLRGALDSAALAIAREGKSVSDKRAMEIAKQQMAANLGFVPTDLKVTRLGTSFRVEGSAPAKMAFAGLIGYSEWQITSASTADVAFTSYEIALVLDTTGSMAGGKLISMKDAVAGLVGAMSVQTNDEEKLKFAIVPFATFVNVGPQFAPQFNAKGKIVKDTGAAWLDLKGDSDFPQTELKKGVSRFEVFHKLKQTWKGCVETRYPSKKGAHDVPDTPATTKDKRSLFVPAFAIDEPDEWGFANSYIASTVDPLDKTTKGQIKKLEKYGLDGTAIMAGLGDLGTGAPPPPTIAASETKGPNAGCNMQPVTPLTSDYDLVLDKVEELQAHGTTNIMEGVAWGMRVLSPGEPFSEGKAVAPGLEKIMVVLTDGANNFGTNGTKLGSSYSADGYLVDGRLGVEGGGSATTTGIMNDRTLMACTNAKAAGIQVYTIRLEEPDVQTGYMLRDCASSPQHFFDVPSRGQLDEVFKEIGKRIAKVRLTS